MSVVEDVINACIAELNDFPQSSDPDALSFLQDADNFVLQKVRLFPTTSEDVSMVSGTREYALDSDIVRIWAATYYSAATSYIPLRATSYDQLDIENPAWRDVTPSNPSEFYDLGTIVGFFPTPAVTAAAGYPIVRLYVTRKRVLALNSDMPAQVPNYNAWRYYALREFARRRHPEMLEKYEALLVSSFNELLESVQGRQPRNKPKYSFPVPRVNNA